MSTYVLMRILESVPSRYDAGIRLLTLGKLNKAYTSLVSHIHEGDRVLDIGCGTGALTLLAAKQGAKVKGIDTNSGMLEIAQNRVAELKLKDRVELAEMGVAELSEEPSRFYDAVVSGLCFSELSEDERRYALKEIRETLKAGGLLMIADEVVPATRWKRFLNAFLRTPLVLITYVVSQSVTHPVKNLLEIVTDSGFHLKSVHLSHLGNFLELVAENTPGPQG